MSTKVLDYNGLTATGTTGQGFSLRHSLAQASHQAALIQFGPNISGLRNSIAGQTFSQNKGGAYAKAKPIPTNPRSAAQRLVRANFAANSKQWSGALTDAQRAAWVFFAQNNPYNNVFGQAKQLSGMAMMMKLNQVLSQILSNFIPNPPSDLSVEPIPNPIAYTGTWAAGIITAVTVSTAAQSAAAGTSYYVFATPPLSSGRSASQSDYRFIGVVDPVAAGVVITLTAAYTAVFGNAAAAGRHVSVLVSQVNDATGATTPGLVVDSGPFA